VPTRAASSCSLQKGRRPTPTDTVRRDLSGALSQSDVAGFGNILGTKGLFRALQSNAEVNILSTPSLVTLNNHEARILVGTYVPTKSGSYSASTTSSSSVSALNTYDRKDVGVMLNVKPEINQGGTVTLQIYQEDSNVQSGTPDQAEGYNINKRSLQTSILADDGQIVVLGGLHQRELYEWQFAHSMDLEDSGVGSVVQTRDKKQAEGKSSDLCDSWTSFQLE
jgi:type II secretory pathway component GspD/PulD (secretin)